MKNKAYVFFIIVMVIIAASFVVALKYMSKDKTDRLVLEGIENFSYDRTSEENTYLLFYPADWRVSQNNTLVREVTPEGEIIHEYEIVDEDFRRMSIHQKPNDLNRLYISHFGEAAIDNFFYTFDIEQGIFKKEEISYFTYDTGVNHIKHYGEDVVFSTIVSHLTGDQELDPETGGFKMSFSNFTREESFETEAGREPSFRPVLQFQGRIIYTGDGSSADLDAGKIDQRFLAFVDEETGEREYENFGFDPYTSFAALYADDDYAYILASTGEVIVLDEQLKWEIHEPFKGIAKDDADFFFEDPDNFLMIDQERALFVSYDHAVNENFFGILNFAGDPSFQLLKEDYINKSSYYRLLYQDAGQGIIYILERNEDFPEDDGKLLIIDKESFELLDAVPVKYEYLIDMVI